MKLSERLTQLLGHKVSITMPAEVRDEYAMKGILQEVGDDYVMITNWDNIAGFPIPGQCYIKVDKTIPIIHTADCRQCRG